MFSLNEEWKSSPSTGQMIFSSSSENTSNSNSLVEKTPTMNGAIGNDENPFQVSTLEEFNTIGF